MGGETVVNHVGVETTVIPQKIYCIQTAPYLLQQFHFDSAFCVLTILLHSLEIFYDSNIVNSLPLSHGISSWLHAKSMAPEIYFNYTERHKKKQSAWANSLAYVWGPSVACKKFSASELRVKFYIIYR